MHEIINKFKEAMNLAGVTPPADIIADGKIHRFSTNGRPSNENGWYILHLDGVPAGSFGDWQKDISLTWCAKSRNQMRAEEWTEHNQRLECIQKNRADAQYRKQLEAAIKARKIWDLSEPADPYHPYLIKKRIMPFSARQQRESLILPVIGIDGQICSLQFIDSKGVKRLLKDGQKKGKFILVNGVIGQYRLGVCEGFATAATLAQTYPDICVIAAIDAGNLEPVATEVRNHFPEMDISIYGDDDRLTLGNPGMTKAFAAARAARAKCILPPWPEDAPLSLSDFNDLSRFISEESKQGGRYE